MPRYKRNVEEAELDIPLEPELSEAHMETLKTLRNMWEFASFMQYIFLFGHVVKIDEDFDIEDLEAECLKPEPSDRLSRMGLQLLKYVSSHRGLTPEIFDEYTRRQYIAKAPRRNPYGEEEDPAKFKDFDIFTKIRVLQQLSTWTFGNADRIRSMMPQDDDHLSWRMEPLGWDKEDRAYFVLDDNRLYRRTDEAPPPPAPTPKAKAKKAAPKKSKSRGTRASKRRKIEVTSEEEMEEIDTEAGADEDTVMMNGDYTEIEAEEEPNFGFTDKTWECVAITLEEYNDFLATIFRTRDPNEKQLRKRVEEDVLPIIEKRAEAIRQKQLKKIREVENVQKMATAKRSSRLAGKAEKEQEEREKRELEEKHQAELRMAHEEQDRQRRIEEGHESRRLTREQRLKEREVKRILHEEELARIEEEGNRAASQDPAGDNVADNSKRISERQLITQKAQHKAELEKLAEDDDKWYFDCSICGVNGDNIDDGSHSVACERCNVWQHSKCHGFSPKQAEKDGFHFVCATCTRKAADAKKPKIAPLKLGKSRQSESPGEQRSATRPATSSSEQKPAKALPEHVARQLDGFQGHPGQYQSPGFFGPMANGPNLTPYGQQQGPPGYRYPPVGNFPPHAQHVSPPQQPWHGSTFPPPQRPSSSGYASSPPPMANGYGPPQQHQQQHQHMHQNAVASTGGHPAYQAPPYQQQPNGYSPHAPAGAYPQTQPPQQQYYQQNRYYNPPSNQQTQRPGSQGQPVNGLQSPIKSNALPSSASPPQHQRQPTNGQQHPATTHSPQAPQQQTLTHSPNTSFPPRNQYYQQQGAHSPVKSSPPSHQQHHQHAAAYRPRSSQQQMAQTLTPQQPVRPPSSNGIVAPQMQHHTPQNLHAQPQAAHPSPAGSNANAVATDGMSGSWPEASKAIPQKHDRSSAAPPPPSSYVTSATQTLSAQQATPSSSQQTGGDGMSTASPRVLQAPTLTPSRQMQEQAQAAGPASVPVKKVLDASLGFVPPFPSAEGEMKDTPPPLHTQQTVNGMAAQPDDQ